MKITGEHAFVSSRERVWAALEDPQMLANALPGVKRLDVTGPGRVRDHRRASASDR